MKQLTDYVNAGNVVFIDTEEAVVPTQIIKLPDDAIPIIKSIDKQTVYFNDKQAFEYLISRKISPLDIYRFNIHSNFDRVILPVYNDGILVSYVARQFRGSDTGLRYLYPAGAKHSDTFLGWVECQQWNCLTLVENSFVSLALRDYQVTTNFGSNFTDTQLEKILKSKIKSVVFLWDEGAEAKADKSVRRLRRLGMPACYIMIKGQPDNYEKQNIENIIKQAHATAKTEKYILDVRLQRN